LVAEQYSLHLPEHCRGELLDLGCGKVPLYGLYRDLVSGVVCVDWAQTLNASNHLDHELDLTKPLPLGDDSFDTILLSDVLEHLPEPGRLLAEVSRLLRPGGKLIGNTPFLYWLHERPHDYFRYTDVALRRLLESAQLEVLSLRAVGGYGEVLTDLLAKRFTSFGVPGRLLARAVQALTWQLNNNARRAERDTAFPAGYFFVATKVGAAPAARPLV